MWEQLLDQRLIESKNTYTENQKKFFIKICENNLQFVNENYTQITDPLTKNNSFLISCAYANNTKMIEFIKKKFDIDKNYKNEQNENCITFACSYNPNVHIIQYLIDTYQMDINYIYNNKTYLRKTCMNLACQYNTNLLIIKYLIEEHKLTVYANDLFYSCSYNQNLEIIKYLIVEMNINIDYESLRGGCTNNPNVNIAKYLIENSDLSIDSSIHFIPLEKYLSIVPMIDNYKRLNDFVSYGIIKYGVDKLNKIIDNQINPLMLYDYNLDKLNIKKPLLFSTHVENVDRLSSKIRIRLPRKYKKINKKEFNDFTNPEALFIHKDLIYYGTKDIVYESMQIFNGLQININEELPVLEGNLGKKSIIVYLQTCYDNEFDIDDIQLMEIKDFIIFIDQYPTKILQINLIEKDLIRYMYKNNVQINDFWKNISIKYQLEDMYLYCHQKSLQ